MPPPLLAVPTTIVLTGGTSGIGAEMCDLLLAEGHRLIIVARGAAALAPHPRLTPITCDLADARQIKAAAAQIVRDHGDAALLINNAALQYACALTDPAFDPAMMEAEVAINLLAPALLTHALLPQLRAHGQASAIVNISSGLAFFPKQSTALYCATKAALHSFSQSLRWQLEDDGVAVIEAVLPLVDTPMTHGRGRGKISAAAAARAILVGVRSRRPEILIGKARLIPLLSRLAPALGRRIMRGS